MNNPITSTEIEIVINPPPAPVGGKKNTQNQMVSQVNSIKHLEN